MRRIGVVLLLLGYSFPGQDVSHEVYMRHVEAARTAGLQVGLALGLLLGCLIGVAGMGIAAGWIDKDKEKTQCDD